MINLRHQQPSLWFRSKLFFAQSSVRWLSNDHPSPALWTSDARARNTIRHLSIILPSGQSLWSRPVGRIFVPMLAS